MGRGEDAGEEHACIPPPPGHSGAASENTSAANSLASSPARSDDGFARVGSANKPCAYQFRPGDAARAISADTRTR